MKVTYSDLQNSRAPAAVGLCPTDPRFLSLTNECLERLMYEGHWHDTVARMRFCAIDSCITYPPQVAAVEAVAICGQPVTLRTPWHEFMDYGAGIRTSLNQTGTNSNCCGSSWFGACGFNESINRGYFPAFSDIIGTNKKLNWVCDLASDIGKEVLALGYDENLNWIRTNQGGTILDGEIILLTQGAGTNSVNFFSSVSDIQFNEERDGQAWLYEYNNDTALRRLIGQYQSFETRPSYVRHFYPGIRTGTQTDDSGCLQTLVEAMVKLNFWPVKSPTDYLCVPCIPALKDMLQALNDAENEPDGIRKKQLIATGIAAARATLDKQLQHFTGDGNRITMNITGNESAYPVPTLL